MAHTLVPPRGGGSDRYICQFGALRRQSSHTSSASSSSNACGSRFLITDARCECRAVLDARGQQDSTERLVPSPMERTLARVCREASGAVFTKARHDQKKRAIGARGHVVHRRIGSFTRAGARGFRFSSFLVWQEVLPHALRVVGLWSRLPTIS